MMTALRMSTTTTRQAMTIPAMGPPVRAFLALVIRFAPPAPICYKKEGRGEGKERRREGKGEGKEGGREGKE